MDENNLAMLIELAVTSRDAAASRVAQQKAQLEQARKQLELLRGYQRDYDRRAQATLSQGCDVAAQDNLRAFTAKLQTAVDAQTREVAKRESAAQAAQAEWQQMEQRVRSLEKLAQRRRDEVRQRADRREQKTNDEVASSRHTHPLAAQGW
jgi:flagellar export protein FliJ